MTLPLPKLDNRNYDELLRESQRVLRRQPAEWTDHNAHDPGITLLELFSWLVEQDVYRLDRTPDSNVRAFLNLVDIAPRPPKVAQTVVELLPEAGAGSIDVAAGIVLHDLESTVSFETAADVTLAETHLVSVMTFSRGELHEHTATNAAVGSLYHPFGSSPETDNALVLEFDSALRPNGNTYSLYVWTADLDRDADTRAKLIDEQQRSIDDGIESCAHGTEDQSSDWRLHYGARTAWEYQSSMGTWLALDHFEDETRALSLSGFVRFEAPADPSVRRIRCRLVAGQYECPPAIDRIAHNTVLATHAVEIDADEALGPTNGRAGQQFQLVDSPIVSGSVRVWSVDDDEHTWTDVAVLDSVGPHARVFLLDPVSGRVRFGDGRVGRVPAADAELVCRYKVGGGPAGNVGPSRLTVADELPVEVAQRFAASGGAPAETLDDAKGRALDFLAGRERAVTLGDFEILAAATPGVPVASARALAGHHPALPCIHAAGSVTVVAVPECPGERPEAGDEFLDAVRQWLLPRCPLTTELHVVGPCFTAVAVVARVHVSQCADSDAIAKLAMAGLVNFFNPFTGGPDGSGWPVGRDVYRSEVMAVLNGIDGVTHVDEFQLLAEDEQQVSCTNIAVCPDCIAVSGDHHISVIERRPRR